jgi:hypothetical protein
MAPPRTAKTKTGVNNSSLTVSPAVKLSETSHPSCAVCNRAVRGDETTRINCDMCGLVFHSECTSMSIGAFRKLLEIVTQTGWVCSQCRTSTRHKFVQLQCANAKLAEEVASLQSTVESIQRAVDDLSTVVQTRSDVPPVVQASSVTVEQMSKAMTDAARRRCNVVVSGLRPQDNIEPDRQFVELCESELGIKPYVDSRRCRWVGKVPTQKLIVSLLSEHAASEVFHVARRLRKSTDQFVKTSIFINPDLTREEAKLAYERRVRKRSVMAAATPLDPTGNNVGPIFTLGSAPGNVDDLVLASH